MSDPEKPNKDGSGPEEKGESGSHHKRASAAVLIDAFAQQYQADRTEAGRREGHRIFREWLTIFGLFLAAVVAAFQWRELRSTDHSIAEQAKAAGEANVAAAKALQQSQRPWVVADAIDMKSAVKIEADRFAMTFNVVLKNTGNSIAKNVFTVARLTENKTDALGSEWNSTDVDLKNWKDIFEKTSKWPMGIVLAPGQSTPQPWAFEGPYDGSPSVTAVKNGTFYILGLIEYKDQFEIVHRTRFAFNPRGDSVSPWDGKTFVVSGGMQEAD